MLKLKAAYAKKVPAESEYSSQSYHCEIECEIPEGLSAQQLNEKVHSTFEFVRSSVENELAGQTPRNAAVQPVQPVQNAPVQQAYAQQPVQNSYGRGYSRGGQQRQQGGAPASPKQISYLLTLITRTGGTVSDILQRYRIQRIDQLPSKSCSELIQELKDQAA